MTSFFRCLCGAYCLCSCLIYAAMPDAEDTAPESSSHINGVETKNRVSRFMCALQVYNNDALSPDVLIHAITNGTLSADMAEDILYSQHSYSVTDKLLICNAILANYPQMRPHQRINTLSYKTLLLTKMEKYELAIAVSTNQLHELNEIPYAVSTLMSDAGRAAEKAGFPQERVHAYYMTARNACDPRTHSHAPQENFGCYSLRCARTLYRRNRYDEAIALLDDTLSALTEEVSWLSPLKDLRTQCRKKSRSLH